MLWGVENETLIYTPVTAASQPAVFTGTKVLYLHGIAGCFGILRPGRGCVLARLQLQNNSYVAMPPCAAITNGETTVYLSQAILGKAIVDKLEARMSAPVLMIGQDIFTRPQLSKVACFNFTAAARLTHLLTNELKVRNTRELFQSIPPQHLALPGLGSICLATIGAAFEIKGLGTLADYVARHTEKGHSIVTFTTMKINVHDIAAAKKEKKELKARQRSRQAKAHEIRVERHVTRTTNGQANGNTQ